jgi:hypothetical protein
MTKMNPRPRAATIVASTLLVAFMVFVLSSPALAGATNVPQAGTTHTVWAYGYVRSVSVGPFHTATGWVYQGDATVGYAVILNQTNTSATVFGLGVERTMGVSFFVEFCRPSCASPTSYANLSFHLWEVTDSRANFTTLGTVTENGAAVPAIALLNSSSSVHANLTESAHSALPGVGATAMGGMVDRSKYLSAAVSSASNVTFASPLGLIPLNLGSAQTWTSASTFNASGSANYAYYYHGTGGPTGNQTTGPVSGQLNFSPSGNVTIQGSYSPADSVTFGGVTYPAIRLTITGPFSVREGFILIPSSADLFAASNEPWGSEQNGTAKVTMSSLDARASAGGHLGIAASSWAYNSASANPADSLATSSAIAEASPAVAEVSPAVAASNPISNTTIQGTPESVAQAQSNQACLTSGVGCPPPAGGATPRGLLTTVGVVIVVAVVGALIALVLVAERRRLPPPAYPNANLYPPGAVAVVRQRPPARPGETPPPPAEEDPLDHLW